MKKSQKGYSLVEILVVLGIFAILATVATQAVFQTIRGSRKSESSIKVRENLNYALSVMERQLRGVTDISSCINNRIDYSHKFGTSYFACISGVDSYIASGSARLTSDQVKLNSCTISCPADLSSVTISLNGIDAKTLGTENVSVPVTTQIFFRQ